MSMNIWLMGKTDLKPLDELMFDSNGLVRIVPAAKLKQFPVSTVQLWCCQRGVYQIPTQELIDWLSDQVRGKNAIEICSGNGSISRALGILRTDSYMQTRPEIQEYYKLLHQFPIIPPSDVVKMDANSAVRHHKPEVVIGAWVTQLFQDGDVNGSVEGVDEFAILDSVEKYIHIGNDGPHGDKRSMSLPHQFYRFDWLVSRGKEQGKNHIALWTKP